MRLAVSMWSYFRAWKEGMSIPEFIWAAKHAGAEGVELLDFFYAGEGVEEKRADVLKALKESGVPCPIFSVAQNFAKTDADDRRKELEKILFGLQEAALFGAGVVRVFAGDVAPGVEFDQARAWIVEGLAEASVAAHSAGIKLALENHGTLAGAADQVVGLIEDVRRLSGNDSLGANPDTGNFHLIDPPSHVAVGKVASYASMVHFKDFRSTTHVGEGFEYGSAKQRFVGTSLGEGAVDLEACVEALKEAKFDGWVSLEYEGEVDPRSAVPRSIAHAKRLLG